MDVQVPSTGHRFYKIDNAIGQILCEAGICIPLHAPTTENLPQPAPPKTDTFSVGVLGSGKPVIILHRPSGEVVRYSEHPRDAAAAFKHIGVTVPLEILRQYEKSFPQDAAVMAEQKRIQIANAQAAQDAQDAPGKPRW